MTMTHTWDPTSVSPLFLEIEGSKSVVSAKSYYQSHATQTHPGWVSCPFAQFLKRTERYSGCQTRNPPPDSVMVSKQLMSPGYFPTLRMSSLRRSEECYLCWGRVCLSAVNRKFYLSALRRSDHQRDQCTDHERRLQHLLPVAKKHRFSLERDHYSFFGVSAVIAMSCLKSEVDLWYN